MTSGGSGDWRSRGIGTQCRSPSARHASKVHEDVARLDVFVNETPLVKPAERCRKADSEGQEARQLERLPEEPIEGLAAEVIKHEHHSSLMAGALEAEPPTRHQVRPQANIRARAA